MSRFKALSASTSTKPNPSAENSNFVSQTTATVLHKADIINYCLKLLQNLLEYWRSSTGEVLNTEAGVNLLKEHQPHSPPDMNPFFLRQFVKGLLNRFLKLRKVNNLVIPKVCNNYKRINVMQEIIFIVRLKKLQIYLTCDKFHIGNKDKMFMIYFKANVCYNNCGERVILYRSCIGRISNISPALNRNGTSITLSST